MSSMNHPCTHAKTPPPITCWGFLDRLFASRSRFRRLMLLAVLITLTTTPPDTLTRVLPAATLQAPVQVETPGGGPGYEAAVNSPMPGPAPAKAASG